jgi:hypothetical protein
MLIAPFVMRNFPCRLPFCKGQAAIEVKSHKKAPKNFLKSQFLKIVSDRTIVKNRPLGRF